MRFISFTHRGDASWGRVSGDKVVDLRHVAPNLKSAITNNLLFENSTGTEIDRAEVRLLPLIPNPTKIFCVGHNYESHRVETGRDPTKHPSIFTRFEDTLVAHEDPICMPKVSTDLDYEAELAVIIGKAGRQIVESEAMSHVAGLTCFNDVSVRDWQWHSRQFIPGKNFPSTGPLGPELVTLDEIDNLEMVRVRSVLNGKVMQDATVDHMLFPIPTIISYISQFTPLSPGDVIATGTPGGVGAKRNPPVWMKPGDEIKVDISNVGTLSNKIIIEGEGQQ